MSVSLFIYGTLLDKEVLELVCGQSIEHLARQSATLPGFEPRYVEDQPFPVLVVAPNSITTGEVVVFDELFMECLHRYESEAFELCEIAVKLADGSDFRCHYFANIGFTEISNRRWILENFQRQDKADFLDKLRGTPPLLH